MKTHPTPVRAEKFSRSRQAAEGRAWAFAGAVGANGNNDSDPMPGRDRSRLD